MEHNYTIDTLVLDDSFISWVRRGQPEDDPWFVWAQDDKNQALATKSADIVRSIQVEAPDVESPVLDRIWTSISEEVQDTGAPKKSPVRFLRWMLPLAASVAILITALWISSSSVTSLATPLAEVKSIRLPDGSVAMLNAVSALSYDEDKWGSDRRVTIQGEVFFDVVEGSTFAVYSPSGVTTVLGTKFNVYDRGDKFEVGCHTGRVRVEAGDQKVELTPGEHISSMAQSTFIKSTLDPTLPDWRAGHFRYTSTSLREVFDEVERQFDVQVIIMNTATRQRAYTGSFDKNDLTAALNAICWPMELSYTVDEKRVTIKG